MKIFVCSQKKIKERNYECTYIYIFRMAVFQPMIKSCGQAMIPVLFMALHFLYFCLTMIISYLCF